MNKGNDFGWALAQLNQGTFVARTGWNGKGMSIELQKPDTNSKMTLPYIYMRTADGQVVPWLASQTDMLATDWVAVGGIVKPQDSATFGNPHVRTLEVKVGVDTSEVVAAKADMEDLAASVEKTWATMADVVKAAKEANARRALDGKLIAMARCIDSLCGGVNELFNRVVAAEEDIEAIDRDLGDIEDAFEGTVAENCMGDALTDQPIQYEHHGTMVYVKPSVKGTHRAACLCYGCGLFKPGTEDGKPVQSWARIEYQWKIED